MADDVSHVTNPATVLSEAAQQTSSAASSVAGLFDLDLNKLMKEFRVPGIDVDAVLATQKKNIEALTKANHLAYEGVQAVARRQSEILRSGFTQATSVLRDAISSGSPEDRLSKQTALAKQSVEQAIANARELAEILTKAQAEAFEVLNRRFTESFDEMKGLVRK